MSRVGRGEVQDDSHASSAPTRRDINKIMRSTRCLDHDVSCVYRTQPHRCRTRSWNSASRNASARSYVTVASSFTRLNTSRLYCTHIAYAACRTHVGNRARASSSACILCNW